MSRTSPQGSGDGEASGDRWKHQNDLFEYTISSAALVFILAGIVAAIPRNAASWRGAVGGPLLLMALALGVFLILLARVIRATLRDPDDTAAEAEQRQHPHRTPVY